ncbi:MAG: stage III sporulation protein AG [Clostridium sp.]
MKKDDIKKEVNNILNNKKIKDAVVVVLILAFLLILISFFTDSKKKQVKATDGPVVSEEQEKSISVEKQNYEEKQKADLENMLRKMKGVGEVKVMMYFKSGEVKVPAIDNNTQVGVTEEKDKEGGNRLSKQETGGNKVVMKNSGGDSEPVFTQTDNPEVTGILVSAEGAENSKIKYDIEKAISSLYGISLDKVNVYPMGN